MFCTWLLSQSLSAVCKAFLNIAEISEIEMFDSSHHEQQLPKVSSTSSKPEANSSSSNDLYLSNSEEPAQDMSWRDEDLQVVVETWAFAGNFCACERICSVICTKELGFFLWLNTIFSFGEGRDDSGPRRTRNTSLFSAISVS